MARRLGGGAEDEAEAEGEVGVDAGVLDLVRREARRVPGAHGDFPGLVDPGVAEEAVATRRGAQAWRAWWGAAGSELRRQSVVDEAVVRRATAQDDGVPNSCSV